MIGLELMEHFLAFVDRNGIPTYLEATNATNLSLYKRFGFRQLSEFRTGSSMPRNPMLRKASVQAFQKVDENENDQEAPTLIVSLVLYCRPHTTR